MDKSFLAQQLVESVGHAPVGVLRTIVILQNRILEAGPDPSAIMQTVVNSAFELLDIDAAVIEIIEETGLSNRAVAGPGIALKLGESYPIQESLSGLSVKSGELLVCEDCEIDPRVNREFARHLGVRSLIVTPLRNTQITYGTLKLMASEPARFTPDHQRVVELLSGFLTRALMQADEAQASRKRFETLANSLPNLAWMSDEHGQLYWFNDRFYEYTGLNEEQSMNWGWRSIHDQRELPRVLETWHHSLATGHAMETIFPVRRADGEFRYFLTRAVPIRDLGGKITAWFGTNTDVHDQHQATLEMARARDQAERASRLKTTFLANMSHEIRTPLGVIIGFADLLGARDVSEAEKLRYVEILKRNGEQLGRLINDILDLSKVESGLVNFEYRSVDPLEIAREVAAFTLVKARTKRIELSVESSENSPRAIVTDSGRVRQILINLVDNAIKFTEAGSVRVSLAKTEDGGCRFDVTDSGIGIAEDAGEKIFKMFNQADESVTRKYGGTGLGLALSRSLARAMGGDVRLARSEAGRGSTFTFTIISQQLNRRATDRVAN